MRQIKVSTAPVYDVLVEKGLFDHCGSAIASVMAPCTAAIVSDDTVDSLYGDAAEASLRAAGFRVCRVVFPHGERSKNLSVLSDVLESLAARGLTRSDMIVALGGGVVGDLAGFAAAVYMRGIRFVQIPTTLLAMIDSSVGGKTAVDLKSGKNLAGAFWQPGLVICDPNLLSTLPRDYLLDGLGEMVKYGMGFDGALLERMCEGDPMEGIDSLIARCIEIKAQVVAADELDYGERQKLNLGHTAAHAIERCSDFSITHGRAVAIGTAIIARACQKRGILPAAALGKLNRALSNCGLDSRCPFTAKQLAEGAANDKKRRGGKINVVLPTCVGGCEVRTIDADALEGLFADGLCGREG